MNKQGELSLGQKNRQIKSGKILLIFTFVASLIFSAGLFSTMSEKLNETAKYLGPVILFTLFNGFGFYFYRKSVRAAQNGKVQVVTGTVQFRNVGKGATRMDVNGSELSFLIPFSNDLLELDTVYNIYYAENKDLVSIEIAEAQS